MDPVGYTTGLSMSAVILVVEFTLAICYVLGITGSLWKCDVVTLLFYMVSEIALQIFNTDRDNTIINDYVCVFRLDRFMVLEAALTDFLLFSIRRHAPVPVSCC